MKQVIVISITVVLVIVGCLSGCSDIDYPNDVLDKSPYDMSGGSIVINDDAEYAYSQRVSIACNVSNAVSMQFSQDTSTWSNLEDFASIKQWVLPLLYGQQTIYGQFFNSGGESIIYQDSIFFIERLLFQPATYLGGDVAISDDGTVVVAGSYEGNANAVYVFRKQSIDWDCTVLKPGDVQGGDKFGFSVALSGDGRWLFAGAPVKKAVYVFEYTGGWQLRQEITSSSLNFGHVVSVNSNGQYITVASSGYVHAYKYNSNQYAPMVVVGSGLKNVCNCIISNDGLWIFAGYYDDTTGGVMSFQRTNDIFGNPKSIKIDDYQIGCYFGKSMALSDNSDYLIIGAPFYDIDVDDDKGAFYIFKANGSGIYELLSEIKNTNGESGDSLGKSIAISGDGKHLIVSAPGADVTVVDRGCVHVYEFINSEYVLNETYIPEDRISKCYFGNSLAISNNGVVAIGAPYTYVNTANDNGGVVYIRRLE